MNFYGDEFFRTVSGSCFRVIFIPGSENHKSHDNFSFIFSISFKVFLWIWGADVLKFLENYNKQTAWWDLYFVTPQVSSAENFLFFLFFLFFEFSGISELITWRATVDNRFWALKYFFSKLFNRSFFFFYFHFFFLKPFTVDLSICEKLLLILKYYFKSLNMSISLKTNLWGNNILIDLAKIIT